eukprot:UN01724
MDSPCRPGNYSSGAVCEPALWIANNNEGHNQNAMFGGCTFDTVGSVNHIFITDAEHAEYNYDCQLSHSYDTVTNVTGSLLIYLVFSTTPTALPRRRFF